MLVNPESCPPNDVLSGHVRHFRTRRLDALRFRIRTFEALRYGTRHPEALREGRRTRPGRFMVGGQGQGSGVVARGGSQGWGPGVGFGGYEFPVCVSQNFYHSILDSRETKKKKKKKVWGFRLTVDGSRCGVRV